MKVIVSHDVDHIRPWDHRRDLIIPKFIVRFGVEWLLGRTALREVSLAIQSLWTGSWQHIEELMDFDAEHEVPSTFFLATANGRKLCYSLGDARRWIARIRERGFDVGVHGIDYQSGEGTRRELARFRDVAGQDIVGIRVHNIGVSRSSVWLDEADVALFRDVGYAYSTTTFGENGPWARGSFWEFPIHLMDVHVFEAGRPWKTRTLEQAKAATVDRLMEAGDRGISHFSLLFHDNYFSDYYRDHRAWYIWLVEYLKTRGYVLSSYRDALSELNASAGNAL